jgi:hypothetical protein
MINYSSFLLEAHAAKRRLAQLFESETLWGTDHLSTTIVAYKPSCAARTCTKHNKKRVEIGSVRTGLFVIGQELRYRQGSQAR